MTCTGDKKNTGFLFLRLLTHKRNYILKSGALMNEKRRGEGWGRDEEGNGKGKKKKKKKERKKIIPWKDSTA